MNPATEYVRKFTEDIDKARVVTAAALAHQDLKGVKPDGQPVDGDASVQSLAKMLMNDQREFLAVQSKDGAALGVLKRQEALDLLLGADA